MVLETVRHARRRILVNEGLRHAAHAVSVTLGSFIFLLLLGTQILSWKWLLLLPALTLAVGAWLAWRNAPSVYRVAQRVDRNLQLADALSTALFFAGAVENRTSSFAPDSGMLRGQLDQAEQIASRVDPRRAIPMRWPRALYGTAILGLLACSLFALRYGLDRRLDLRAPLAQIVQDRLGYTQTRQLARQEKKAALHDPKHPEEPGFSVGESGEKTPGELDPAPDSALDTVGVPDVDKKSGSAARPGDSKMAQSTELEGERNKSEEPEGVSANPGNQPGADGRKGQGAGKQGEPGDKDPSANSGENSGLLGKFKDAMSSLMNRMRQASGKTGQQQASAQSGAQQKSQSGNPAQNGKPGQQPGDGQQSEARDGQPGDDSQNAQSAQSGSPGESGQQPASKQPGSGIGRQDGAKDVKLAEQLAAMGKISEIIGKRAANVSGELTMEVENSNQQLRTPYAPREAHHTQAGGEINRDEIPGALQAYVEQYFEQVRKQALPETHTRKHAEPLKPGL